jgi:hypothetical protein
MPGISLDSENNNSGKTKSYKHFAATRLLTTILKAPRLGTEPSTEDIANFVDQAFIFQILIFNCRELFQKSALLARQ